MVVSCWLLFNCYQNVWVSSNSLAVKLIKYWLKNEIHISQLYALTPVSISFSIPIKRTFCSLGVHFKINFSSWDFHTFSCISHVTSLHHHEAFHHCGRSFCCCCHWSPTRLCKFWKISVIFLYFPSFSSPLACHLFANILFGIFQRECSLLSPSD